MWLFTNRGFLSIVADYERPGNLLVRARKLDHLAAIFPDADISATPERDYRFRASIPQAEFAKVISHEIDGIDYHNFKNSIREDAYHNACSKVWGVMYEYQGREKKYNPPLETRRGDGVAGNKDR